jgi:hypothetical protein
MNIPLKNYELSVCKGFDTIRELVQYLEDMKAEIVKTSTIDGITENVLSETLSGDGWDVEVGYSDEITH